MHEILNPNEGTEFEAGTNEYAHLAEETGKDTELEKEAEVYATWPRAEEFYAHPELLDRKLEEQLTFRPPEAATEFVKEKVEASELPLRELIGPPQVDKGILRSWEKPGSQLQETLNDAKGPFVEFGGPTYGEYSVLEGLDFPQKVLVSNLEPGLPMWKGDEKHIVGGVDFQADANQMPLQNESTGAIFVSAMPLEGKGFQESFRALEPGGLLFYNSSSLDKLKLATDSGFELVKAVYDTEPAHHPYIDVDPRTGSLSRLTAGCHLSFENLPRMRVNSP